MPTTSYTSPKPAHQTGKNNSQPPISAVAVFQWERFEPLTNYSDQNLLEVFKRISRDIIERPYHYDKHQVFNAQGKPIGYSFKIASNIAPPEKIQGVSVYKRNHGTGHAIRQMIYTDVLIDKIAKEGTPKGQQIGQIITGNPEIKSILKLAAYCKRIGRTLDYEHDDHGHITIYSKRSAEMFSQIATELGYSKDLTRIISESMLEPTPKHSANLKSKNIAEISDIELGNFSKSVLMAAHMADLARLFTVKRNYITNSLIDYFDATQLTPVATELVEMACNANIMTGNPVVPQERGVNHTVTAINGKILVEVVTNIDKAIQKLNTLKEVREMDSSATIKPGF